MWFMHFPFFFRFSEGMYNHLCRSLYYVLLFLFNMTLGFSENFSQFSNFSKLGKDA